VKSGLGSEPAKAAAAGRSVRSRTLSRGLLVAAAVWLLFPQELRHTSGVVNVEVPVRVFDGDRFVDDLSLADFELFEDGKPQRIISLYVVRKTKVQREESSPAPKAAPTPQAKAVPETVRNFVLIFEVHEPMPKIDEAIDYFFREVFRRGDRAAIVSPKGSYHFRQETSDRIRPAEISRQIKRRLRKDILAGSVEYRRLIQDIKDMEKLGDMGSDAAERAIENDIRQLRDRLTVTDQGIRQLARQLKAQEGRKVVFLFYEKEEIPAPGPKYSDSANRGELDRPLDFNAKEIEKLFADASMTVNFIFLTNSSTGTMDITDVRPGDRHLMDLSPSLYGAFRDMSRASGGTTEVSANAMASLKKTVAASENYYLLYYSPAEYKADGKFKEIEVRVKGKSYRVSHRAGYVAD
jgi:VWFA-related protein